MDVTPCSLHCKYCQGPVGGQFALKMETGEIFWYIGNRAYIHIKPLSKKQVPHALHDLYCSLNIIMVIRSREKKWMGHTACMEKLRNMKILSHDEWREIDHLGDADADGRIILKCVWKTHNNRVWSQLAQDTVQWQAPENTVWNSGSITGGEIMTFRALNSFFKNNCSMDLPVVSFQELVLVWQQYRASICCRSTLVHVSL